MATSVYEKQKQELSNLWEAFNKNDNLQWFLDALKNWDRGWEGGINREELMAKLMRGEITKDEFSLAIKQWQEARERETQLTNTERMNITFLKRKRDSYEKTAISAHSIREEKTVENYPPSEWSTQTRDYICPKCGSLIRLYFFLHKVARGYRSTWTSIVCPACFPYKTSILYAGITSPDMVIESEILKWEGPFKEKIIQSHKEHISSENRHDRAVNRYIIEHEKKEIAIIKEEIIVLKEELVIVNNKIEDAEEKLSEEEG